jgi:1-pyrroline-5-carboxylate dehydrogenase
MFLKIFGKKLVKTFIITKPIQELLEKQVEKILYVAHPSANVKQVVTGIVRGAFEFQGQKCSAASRAYIPQSLWADVKEQLITDVKSMKMGSPEDFSNFITAVIHEGSFDKLASYIDQAKKDADAEIILGWKL